MKKNLLLLACAVLISACSINVDQFLGIPPTPIPAPIFTSTITNTPTEVPTITPTVPTPTFTVTPTLIGIKTKTFTPESTATVLIVKLAPSESPVPQATEASINGFVRISRSSDVFYKQKACLPVSVTFTAQVSDPQKVAYVTLFVRFKSKLVDVASKWTSIAMDKQTLGAGTFTHELIPTEMKAVDSFENAWVQYQLVATDFTSKQIAKTDVFTEKLALLNCVPTPIPTIANGPTAALTQTTPIVSKTPTKRVTPTVHKP
jgi:hypothetical protein